MISPVLSRRRIPVIVRREDTVPTVRGRRQSFTGSSTRRGSRRAPRRMLRRGEGTRSLLIAVAVLLAASTAWILTFVYLASLG